MPYSTGTDVTRPYGPLQGGNGKQIADRAVSLAGEGRWAEAAAANRVLLRLRPKDTSSLNRLGKCLTELGRYEEAAATYQQSLDLDALNSVASKNLARLSLLTAETATPTPSSSAIDPRVFVTDPGTSAETTLTRSAHVADLANYSPGAELELCAEGGTLVVRDPHGRLLGAVKARLASRLLGLMSGGNRYAAALASSTASPVRVLLRETHRDPSQADKVSFPAREVAEVVRAFTRNGLLRSADEGDDDDDDADGADSDSTSTAKTGDYPDADAGEEEPTDTFAGAGPVVARDEAGKHVGWQLRDNASGELDAGT
ncbi:MAG: tetratricopeptide repeat protein [Chloroflexi bacterium]|nr:tetratricopeptide repeat protein [Chloroflexota bacterium]MCL5109419.1 tetratricopeptide repeat protein [Chloroflexota bacterium]